MSPVTHVVKTARGRPDFHREAAARKRGLAPVAGIDEAGRGPWAGPVVAAAVVLDPAVIPPGIDDSKTLDEAERERLFEALCSCAQIGVGIAEVERIDRDNILAATLWAMARAVDALPEAPALALVDGNRAPELACKTETVVGGDAKSLSIAAASIIAKVTRDRIMRELAVLHPEFGWDRNKGYGTRAHQAALVRHGPTVHHRRSFAPIRDLLAGAARASKATRQRTHATE